MAVAATSAISFSCHSTAPINDNNNTILTGPAILPNSSTCKAALTMINSATKMTSLSSIWREIQGSGDWRNLVEPLNPTLREEIVRYGEFVAACYRSFDTDKDSRRFLNCKHGQKRMLREAGLPESGYDITKYVYTTPDIPRCRCRSRWIGYVAVSGDAEMQRLGRRDVLVSFRGTVTAAEWAANLMSSLSPAQLDPLNPRPEVRVESGFLRLYTSSDRSCKYGSRSCRDQLLREISRIIVNHHREELSITLAGHSMGGALALLLGYDLAELGLNKINFDNKRIPITVFSFGGPRVGNTVFKQRCDELGVKVLRVVNINDPVTKLPGILLNENICKILKGRYHEHPWSCNCYAHVGVELALDFFEMNRPACVHDLEDYLRLLKSDTKEEEEEREGRVGGREREKIDWKVLLIRLMEKFGQFCLEGKAKDAAIHVGNNLVQVLGM